MNSWDGRDGRRPPGQHEQHYDSFYRNDHHARESHPPATERARMEKEALEGHRGGGVHHGYGYGYEHLDPSPRYTHDHTRPHFPPPLHPYPPPSVEPPSRRAEWSAGYGGHPPPSRGDPLTNGHAHAHGHSYGHGHSNGEATRPTTASISQRYNAYKEGARGENAPSHAPPVAPAYAYDSRPTINDRPGSQRLEVLNGNSSYASHPPALQHPRRPSDSDNARPPYVRDPFPTSILPSDTNTGPPARPAPPALPRKGSKSTRRSESPPVTASAKRPRTAASSASDSEDGEDNDRAKDKLEVKREKNRVKQRNLRMRRANHITDLELQVSTLRAEKGSIEQQHTDLTIRTKQLERYVADLEAVLAESGMGKEAALLKSAWKGLEYAGRDAVGLPPGSVHPPRPAHPSMKRPSASGSTGNDSFNSSQLDPSSVPMAQTSSNSSSGAWLPSGGLSPWPSMLASGMNSGIGTVSDIMTTDSGHETAPSPRTLRIEDLLSPPATFSALVPTPTLTPPTMANGGDTGLSGTTASSDEPMTPEYIPLNLNFKVEPWMMEGWLTEGLPPELGDPLVERSMRRGTTGWSEKDVDVLEWEGMGEEDGGLRTMQSGMSFGPSSETFLPLTCIRTVHPCVHVARRMLRSIIPNSRGQPVSSWTIPDLEPLHQRIILSAITQLGDTQLTKELIRSQVDNLPPTYAKMLMEYQMSPSCDLRLVLMPIAILRARIVTFLRDGLPFDLTAFITHVLADAVIFGDIADPDAWEMSETFWDVWGGWFKNGRNYCSSLHNHRRRFGHTGCTVLQVIMGMDTQMDRMRCLIGKPDGWVLPSANVKPDESVSAIREIN